MKLASLSIIVLLFTTCGGAPNANQSNSNAVSHQNQVLTVVERPQKIKDLMAARGRQDEAAPTLKIVWPAEGITVNRSTVLVKLEISGDLKGYKPHMDEATKMGNHIHVILDNQPYEAYYNIDGAPFELRNVSSGEHTLRVFASRPWHEGYKNKGSFQIVKFNVRNPDADSNQPVTTNSGQQMSNVSSNTSPTPEGKSFEPSQARAVSVDDAKPLLTYSRPKGEYKGADADAIMIDFWLTNATLVGDDPPFHREGHSPLYRVRYSVDGGEPKFIDKWQPIWLSGWTSGKHSIKLELVDESGNVFDNGGYNSTTREITVTR